MLIHPVLDLRPSWLCWSVPGVPTFAVLYHCGEAAILQNVTEEVAWETLDDLGCHPIGVYRPEQITLTTDPWVKNGILRCSIAEVFLMPWVKEAITLREILDAKPETIFYAVHTTWWTHRREDLSALQGNAPVPIDPRGSTLFETNEVQAFLQNAMGNAAHYGKHGLRAFMAAHHDNMRFSEESDKPWALETWSEVNHLLDRQDSLLAERANRESPRSDNRPR